MKTLVKTLSYVSYNTMPRTLSQITPCDLCTDPAILRKRILSGADKPLWSSLISYDALIDVMQFYNVETLRDLWLKHYVGGFNRVHDFLRAYRAGLRYAGFEYRGTDATLQRELAGDGHTTPANRYVSVGFEYFGPEFVAPLRELREAL